MTSEEAEWIFSKIIFLKSVHQAEKNELPFLRSLRPNFGFHLVFTSFHLEFLSFWISRSFDLGDLSDLENPTVKDFHS